MNEAKEKAMEWYRRKLNDFDLNTSFIDDIERAIDIARDGR